MLYVIATPIGNLQDISLRAINTLKACDYILCEDTRHSLKLLQHYDIHKPLTSFHQHNEKERQAKVIEDLLANKEIALISDAGTPLISDPGFVLIKTCREMSIPLTCLPGPCASICALTLSGFEPTPFQYVGFLPRKKGELITRLEELLEYPGTSICYETSERLSETLSAISDLDPQRLVAVARELTKRFEELSVGVASALQQQSFKGEIVLLIQGKPEEMSHSIFSKEFLQSCVHDVAQSMSEKEAISLVAHQLKLPKRQVYNAIHQ